MTLPNFAPKPELERLIEIKGVSHLKDEYSKLFSHESWEKIHNFVLNSQEKPGSLATHDILSFVNDYSQRILDRENGKLDMMSDDNRYLFDVLKKYPNAVSELLKPEVNQKLLQLDVPTKTALLYAWYYQYCLEYERDGTVFNGTKQYQINQNIHGDVSIRSYEYDQQGDLFPWEKPAVQEIDESRYESIFMYQETTALLTALCMLYRRIGGNIEDFEDFCTWLHNLESKTPFASDIGLDMHTVQMAKSRMLNDFQSHQDTTGNYEDVNMNIFSWPQCDSHPKITISKTFSLDFLVHNKNGDICFKYGNESKNYKKIFSIPKNDIFWIMQLLYQFPGRSGATIRQILRDFIVEYLKEYYQLFQR